ncbi:hypothetical protein LCGC14_1703970 [marine sediment metagenome]|uniref:Uncharacterized protein n=1 Tax=marine sediment metagenome TaxID=412755 RepID=A0A0F9HGU7_9ZZZZ
MEIKFRQHNNWCVITIPSLSLVIDKQVKMGRLRFVGICIQLSILTWWCELWIYNRANKLQVFRGRE